MYIKSRILINSQNKDNIRLKLSPDILKTNKQRIYKYRLLKDDLKLNITLFSKFVLNKKLANKNHSFLENFVV